MENNGTASGNGRGDEIVMSRDVKKGARLTTELVHKVRGVESD